MVFRLLIAAGLIGAGFTDASAQSGARGSRKNASIWLEPAAQRYSISGRVSWPDDAAVEKVVIEYGGPEGVHHGVWYVADPGGLCPVAEATPESTGRFTLPHLIGNAP